MMEDREGLANRQSQLKTFVIYNYFYSAGRNKKKHIFKELHPNISFKSLNEFNEYSPSKILVW